MTDLLSPKERLLRTLNKQSVDRPPVICPGGMMNAAIVEIMKETGNTLPAAHLDEQQMAALSADVQGYTGFENFGIPFCMTIEAEVLGSEVHYGSLECEPKIQREIFPSAKEVHLLPLGTMDRNRRVGAVLQSICHLSKNSDIPVIGSLTGPLSTAASLVDPMQFLKGLRRDKEASHQFIDYVCGHLLAYAKMMVENGAAAISIADPTATGEILGPTMFEEYAIRYLNRIIDSLHQMKVPVILHICGRMEAVKPQIAMLHGDALSVDAFVSLKHMKEEIPEITTMGNLSTYLLEFGTPEKVYLQAERLLKDKVDIIAPACGLSTSTPLENIRAFTRAVIK